MELDIRCLNKENFPSLAWVAQVDLSFLGYITVWCGELVETGPDYVVEGVWPGDFNDMEFDTSELFYGSGVRIKGDSIFFVSSCSTVDRIWCHREGDSITVSNSLPCLLDVVGVNLVESNDCYASLVESIVSGRKYKRFFPVNKGELQVHYFENVIVKGDNVHISSKCEYLDRFDQFESYARFLFQTAEEIGRNSRDPLRKRPIGIFSTISRGYDSPVASVLAKLAGSKKTVTIKSARSLLGRSDSGADIAAVIGLECEEYISERSNIRDELWYWAANGSLQDMNLSIFDYPVGPSVIFTGFNGGMIWEKSGSLTNDWLRRKDSTGLGFCEHRLVKGVIHCPVPFWGIRNIADIKKISNDPKMLPWSLGGGYDRPIPRRILEEAGVPRHYFGQTKSATAVDELLLLPIQKTLMKDYLSFQKVHYGKVNIIYTLPISRKIIDLWREVFRQRVLDMFGRIRVIRKRSRTFKWERGLFPWANHILKLKLRRK
jgi:hypothetical protein